MGFFSSAESGAGPLSCNPPSPHQTSRGYWMQWSSISSRDSSEGGRLEKCSSLPSQLRRRSPRYLSLGQGKLRQVTSKLGTFLPQESPAHLWNIGTTPASPALQSGWRSVGIRKNAFLSLESQTQHFRIMPRSSLHWTHPMGPTMPGYWSAKIGSLDRHLDVCIPWHRSIKPIKANLKALA